MKRGRPCPDARDGAGACLVGEQLGGWKWPSLILHQRRFGYPRRHPSASNPIMVVGQFEIWFRKPEMIQKKANRAKATRSGTPNMKDAVAT